MPELPDISLYLHHLSLRFRGRRLERLRLGSPFLLRTFEPPVREAERQTVLGFRRIGKRIIWELENGLFLVVHLMIAGRFHLKKPGASVRGKGALAAFDFDNASLLLTEAGTKQRASLHIVRGAASLVQFDRGGIDVLAADEAAFSESLHRENHTLKRALTDPRLFDGIGNSYSDEILHRAGLSPLQLTSRLDRGETRRLYEAARSTLRQWIDRLRDEQGERFPERVTAFRPDMAVHGRFQQPCPVCRTPIQRIVYAENECNYCPRCQTGGRILADRSLSRLLKDDWPRTVEELESGHPG